MTEVIEEDAEHTLVFVDMLGFAAFTEKYPTRTASYGPDEKGFTGYGTTPLQQRVVAFGRVLDQLISEWNLYGGLPAMIFSDCAYLDGGNPLRAALVAVGLMQAFLGERIPVRIGIGKGTFYSFEYSTRVVGDSVVSVRATFAGTAVIRAHAAEHRGGKGLRIFLNSSLEPDVSTIRRRIKVIALDPPSKGAKWELDYLIQHRDTQFPKPVANWDEQVWSTINELDDPAEENDVRIHYSETRNALDRMRVANGQPKFNRP